jgi:hypothetical protein
VRKTALLAGRIMAYSEEIKKLHSIAHRIKKRSELVYAANSFLIIPNTLTDSGRLVQIPERHRPTASRLRERKSESIVQPA